MSPKGLITNTLETGHLAHPSVQRQRHLMSLHLHHGKFLAVKMVRILNSLAAFQVAKCTYAENYVIQVCGSSRKQKIGIPVGG